MDKSSKAEYDVNASDKNGVSEFHNAVLTANELHALIVAAIDVNARDDFGFTVLHTIIDEMKINPENVMETDEASNDVTYNIIDQLINNGANVNAMNVQLETPLHIAAFKGATLAVKQLIETGSYVNVVNFCNETPLHYAILGDSKIETIKLLLDNGALVDPVNSNNFTPLELCLKKSYSFECHECQVEIIKLLHKYGARLVNANKKHSALCLATEYGAHREVVDTLSMLESPRDFNDEIIREERILQFGEY